MAQVYAERAFFTASLTQRPFIPDLLFTGCEVAPRSQKIDSCPLQDRHQPEEENHGQGTIGDHRDAESPAVSQHPGQDQKHGQGRQDKPERSLGVIGDALGLLTLRPHPDHGEERSEWQGNQQR